jgi:Mor family transcriptional regulator
VKNLFKGFSLLKYANAKDILPPELLAEVQKYITGAILYVPIPNEIKTQWGQLSGIREEIRHRNRSIVANYRNGVSVDQLMDAFCLSEASIRKIIYAR